MNDLELAKKTLSEGGYTCVLARNGEVITCSKRGVAPLLELLDTGLGFGYHAADRVAGKAGALLYAQLGVRNVHAQLVSEPAFKAFTDNGIGITYDNIVPFIVNRTGDGLCPIEQAVLDIDDPYIAYGKITEYVGRMRAK